MFEDFCGDWTFEETILSLAEHTQKCLIVKYLSWIECDFQKSRVKGSWVHKDSVSAKKYFKKFYARELLTYETQLIINPSPYNHLTNLTTKKI